MKKTLKGKIISLKSKNTATVLVTRTKLHPKYNKKYKIDKKYQSHYIDDSLALGDDVIIQESTPVSKTKKWSIIKPETKNQKPQPKADPRPQRHARIGGQAPQEEKTKD